MLIETHKEDKVLFAHLHYTETPCKVPTPRGFLFGDAVISVFQL